MIKKYKSVLIKKRKSYSRWAKKRDDLKINLKLKVKHFMGDRKLTVLKMKLENSIEDLKQRF